MLYSFAMPQHEHNSRCLPAHASPAFPPIHSPQAHPPNNRTISDFHLSYNKLDHHDSSHHDHHDSFHHDHHDSSRHDHKHHDPPPNLISPAFTPPATPGTGTPAIERGAKSVLVDTSLDSPSAAPKLVQKLPKVWCEVRARIPTTTGQEMFLHLYKNNADSKEHLAIVFGPHIRSQSLDAVRPGEDERDRMIRGAYVGRLRPGRTSSRIEQLKSEAAETTASPPTTPDTEMNGTEHTDEERLHGEAQKAPLVRIHSECYTGETVWSARCDCGEQLDEAARLMALPSNKAGGVIIYLRQEGRGIGLGEKLKAYNLQDLGHDTYEANLLLRHPADARSYGLATAMLVDLGVGGETGIRLLTNNPDKIRAVEGPGREVVVKERVAMVPLAWQTGNIKGVQGEEVEKYLSTKIEK
ncbi:GTP cyclohydrolase II [Venturia nashicola]|uniref:GTP cyclohydrolase II n=1 Tax=Venturia nashicola TaxID=86259 RepID=A0A4Z1NCC7_9PEZI|nr:GTP cyclohydrolase II [Venturia nashicola]TLD15091.1 GTP cyclohydrolase II [Venturia nashicola]